MIKPNDIATTHDASDCAKRIHAANDKFGKQFSAWIQTVGVELRKAQELLANGGNGCFEKWCRNEFGWSRQRAYQLIDATMTFDAISLSTIVDKPKLLPTNEAQLRELSKLSEDDVAEVWQAVVTEAETEKKPITARMVKEHVEKHQQAEAQEDEDDVVNVPSNTEKSFDVDKAGARLRDWLRNELDRWPDEERFRAAHQIRQILEKEFRLPCGGDKGGAI